MYPIDWAGLCLFPTPRFALSDSTVSSSPSYSHVPISHAAGAPPTQRFDPLYVLCWGGQLATSRVPRRAAMPSLDRKVRNLLLYVLYANIGTRTAMTLASPLGTGAYRAVLLVGRLV